MEPRRRERQPGLRCRRFSHRASARRSAEADLRVPHPSAVGPRRIRPSEGPSPLRQGLRSCRGPPDSRFLGVATALAGCGDLASVAPAATNSGEARAVRVAGGGFPCGTPPSHVRRLPPRFPCGPRLGCLSGFLAGPGSAVSLRPSRAGSTFGTMPRHRSAVYGFGTNSSDFIAERTSDRGLRSPRGQAVACLLVGGARDATTA